MAKIRIPPPDVPAIDPATGKWTTDYYDIIKGLERLRFFDLADVSITPPTDGQVPVYSGSSKLWTPGSN
jgi:hypothetical protein